MLTFAVEKQVSRWQKLFTVYVRVRWWPAIVMCRKVMTVWTLDLLYGEPKMLKTTGENVEILFYGWHYLLCQVVPKDDSLDHKSRLMRLHADSLELRRLKYDLIYTYKVVFGLVNGAANDLFTLTSLIYSTGTRGHTYKLLTSSFSHCNRVDLYKYFLLTAYNRHMEHPTCQTEWLQ